MKPVALLQHDPTQQPGFLLDYLDEIGVPTRRFTPDEAGEAPRHARDFSGIVLLGSNHSVNEPQRWIAEEIDLVRDAFAADVPVLGHCFGAQLIAKSLGAQVCRHAWTHIGWSRLNVTPAAWRLFGGRQVASFNWHHETFSIPSGAQRLLYGPYCLNKAFSIGKHLAFQCHFEVTREILQAWCREGEAELARAAGPAVQSRREILSQMDTHLPALHETARRVYRRFASGLVRPPIVHYAGGW